MKVINPVVTNRVTTIELSDRELQIIDACLSKIDDDNSFKGLNDLYNEISDARSDLDLDFLDIDEEG